jgi:type 2 lantibiotic biosynthesis protein LanM
MDRTLSRNENPSASVALLESPSESGLAGHSAWYRSLHLAERLQGSSECIVPVIGTGGHGDPGGSALALGRLAEWRVPSPFGDAAIFARRLALDGIDERTLLSLLGESDAALAARFPQAPPWLAAIEEELLAEPSPSPARPIPPGLFTALLAAPIARAIERVRQRAARLAAGSTEAPFDPQTIAPLLFAGMTERLDWILGRAVVLELQVAGLTDRLRGATPQERFRGFLAELRQPARWQGFLAEYPVLARLVCEALESWVEVSGEILERLRADWRDLLAAFWPDDPPGLVSEVSGGVGDSHAGGRTVRVLRFTSGERLVYKPRPMGIDVRFAELLAWLNQRGAPDLRVAKVVDRGPYGWMEFVRAEACKTREELQRFYTRQGAFLVLLYVLNANDFHRENLIAAGEHPILIDLETLCAPDYGRADPATFDSLAQFELNDSVMRVMLLPFFHENREGQVVDLSGLGGRENELSAHDALVWEAAGTDAMHLVRQRLSATQTSNRPSLGGKVVNPLDFKDEIEAGFTAMYRLLLAHRDELSRSSSPLLGFRGERIRVVLRASQFYAFILRESYHPDLLRDALDRERHFDRIWFGMERSHFGDLAQRLIPSEREDFWRSDIPCFRAEAGSRDALSSLGDVLPNLFLRSGLEMVFARLRQLGDGDLERQLVYVRGSLLAAAMEAGIGLRRYEPLAASPPEEPACAPIDDPAGDPACDPKLLLRWAAAVTERIAALAKRLDGRASWTGLAEIAGRGWWLRALDTDFYAGLPGVALFLAYSGRITGDPLSTRLAEETLPTLRTRIDLRQKVRTLGAFDGWGGIVYTLTHLASLWRREDLLAEALALVPRMTPLVDSDFHLDLLRGAAGGIVPLLHLARLSGEAAPLELARHLGDRLVAAAQPFDGGLAWLVAASPLRPLTGFSHGASGIAWALLELYAATGDERYRETARSALAFEDSTFVAEKGNWLDLRGVPLDQTRQHRGFMAAWCHGAVGIGLTRIRMLRHLQDPRLEQDARIAVATSCEKGFGWCHPPCHGDLGPLDLLLEAHRALGDSWFEAERQRRLARLVGSFEEHGFLCGVPGHMETPGLMDGLAGIGHGLLRQAHPERVPSVLLLDPPA